MKGKRQSHAVGRWTWALALVGLVSLGLIAGTAWAKVRAGSGGDPRESNLPANRDIERVTASYDDRTGSFAVSVRLYGAVASPATAADLVVLAVDFGPQAAGTCSVIAPYGATFLADLDPNRTTVNVSSPRFMVPVAGMKTVTADRREVRLSLARLDMVGMDIRCAQATVRVGGATAFDQLDAPIFFPGPFPPLASACVVPKVVGRTLGQAKAAMTTAGCSLGTVRRARSKRMRAGRIISQRPAAGAKLTIGSRVAVVVSRGVR